MKKIFGGVFSRADKPAPKPVSSVTIDGEEFDIEYVKYCIENDRTVSALEAKLHESDDPREIAEEALKTACQFYGGDWAGILDVDLDLDMWTLLWWYNANPQDTTTSLFGEFSLQSPCRTGLKHSKPALPSVLRT
jgi:DNA-binding transcriptional activator of the SARP family